MSQNSRSKINIELNAQRARNGDRAYRREPHVHDENATYSEWFPKVVEILLLAGVSVGTDVRSPCAPDLDATSRVSAGICMVAEIANSYGPCSKAKSIIPASSPACKT